LSTCKFPLMVQSEFIAFCSCVSCRSLLMCMFPNIIHKNVHAHFSYVRKCTAYYSWVSFARVVKLKLLPIFHVEILPSFCSHVHVPGQCPAAHFSCVALAEV
jgi:hypothetical protein